MVHHQTPVADLVDHVQIVGDKQIRYAQLPAQPGEHPVILKILSGLVQRQGKQDTLPLELGEVFGPADEPNLPACQSTVQYPVQPSLVHRVGEGGIEYSQGHTLTF